MCIEEGPHKLWVTTLIEEQLIPKEDDSTEQLNQLTLGLEALNMTGVVFSGLPHSEGA